MEQGVVELTRHLKSAVLVQIEAFYLFVLYKLRFRKHGPNSAQWC